MILDSSQEHCMKLWVPGYWFCGSNLFWSSIQMKLDVKDRDRGSEAAYTFNIVWHLYCILCHGGCSCTIHHISISKIFTIDSAALLHNILLLVEINGKHTLSVEIIDLLFTPNVPGNGMLYIRAPTLLIRDNKRYCCFKCPFDWAEGLTGNVKGFGHCFKAGSIELQ